MKIKFLKYMAICSAALFSSSCILVPDYEGIKLDKDKMTLVWEEQFTSIDKDVWTFETGKNNGWGNKEVQDYKENNTVAHIVTNTDCEDTKCLRIRAQKSGSEWSSARIKTAGKLSWTYGYFEASLKVPKEEGTWPAFWMMPENNTYGDGWPMNGELDIMEHGPKVSGLDRVYSTVHYGRSTKEHKYTQLISKVVEGASDGFHKYGMYWTKDFVAFFYDDEQVGEIYYASSKWSKWPYDQPFYIILNLAMGGNLGGAIDSKITSADYLIDWIRVYQ